MDMARTYKLLSIDTKNGCVRLEKDVFALPHSLQALDRDVFLVSQSQANQIENHWSVNFVNSFFSLWFCEKIKRLQ